MATQRNHQSNTPAISPQAVNANNTATQPAGVKTVSVHQQSQSWSGPLPPPAALQQFNDVVAGSAQIIVGMAKQQQEHRISVEGKLVDNLRIGLILGGVVALVALGGAIYLAKDAPWVAGCLVSLPVLGFIKILVSGGASKDTPTEQQTKKSKKTK